jgi:serine/threonine protein kinase
MTLVLEDSGGEPLDRLISGKIETPQFSRLGIGLAKALCSLRKKGLIHKDVKPADVLPATDRGKAALSLRGGGSGTK